MANEPSGQRQAIPPALVDDTADPEKAARDIILGHSFDNNMPCTSEKEVVVTAGIADALMNAFRKAGNVHVLDPAMLPQLEQVVLNSQRHGPNRKFVGQNACVILAELGIKADENMRAIVVEVDKDHPFVRHELMMPVLGVVRVRDFEEGVEVAVEVEAGLRHSAIIHSSNIYHMSEYGRAINTTIFVKNAPSYAGLGFWWGRAYQLHHRRSYGRRHDNGPHVYAHSAMCVGWGVFSGLRRTKRD